jgi:hypothetical protein
LIEILKKKAKEDREKLVYDSNKVFYIGRYSNIIVHSDYSDKVNLLKDF